jgi:peptide deformylase
MTLHSFFFFMNHCMLSRNLYQLLFFWYGANLLAPSEAWTNRRACFHQVTAMVLATATDTFIPLKTEASNNAATVNSPNLQHPFKYSDQWTGTSLPQISLTEAVFQARQSSDGVWKMGRWPDPILRLPAESVPSTAFGTSTLQTSVETLIRTAQHYQAVGLAASQCGVNARLIVLQQGNNKQRWHVFVNPRIIERSPEADVRVWTEHCLVLPPTLAVTLLRDARVTVQYQTINDGSVRQVQLSGEAARAFQHEYDHDRGILVTDHIIDKNCWPDALMAQIEAPGRAERQAHAFSRFLDEPFVSTT